MMRPVEVLVPWTAPPAPTNLTFTRGSVILNWVDATPVNYLDPTTWHDSNYEIGFRIEQAPVSGPDAGVFTQVAVAPANSTTFTYVAADPTITYDYRVTAFNVAGDAPSNVVRVEGLPAAPSALTATLQQNAALSAGSQVALDWTNNAMTASTNVVERAVVTNGVAGAYSVLDNTLAPTATSYVDTTVVPGDYSYRVNAVNVIGPSAYSNAATVTVPQPGSTTIVLSAPNPSGFGQSVTFTATVSPVLAAGTPTGSVTFNGSAPVALDAAGQATFTTSTLPAGTTTMTAVYSGDTIFGPSSATVDQVVNLGTTATSVVSAPNASVFGDNVTFTATVSPTGVGVPTGSVEFFDGTTSLGSGTLVGSTATFQTAGLAVGSHQITAVFHSGGGAFTGSTSPVLTHVVNRGTTAVALTSSVNPSAEGDNVTFTAGVSILTGVGFASGTVQFFDGGASLGTTSLSGGQASISLTSLAVGSHSVTAVYSGDGNFSGSTAAALTQRVLRRAVTVVTSNRSPSANLGQSVTFTAAVTAAIGTGVPTGTVRFSIDGVDVGVVVALNAQGRATYATAALSAGSHTVVATYGGSTTFASSVSAPFTQVVNQAASTTVLTSNRNPSVFGQSVTFTARVTPAAAIGTVQFIVDGTAFGGPVTLDATGRARLAVSSLPVATHTIRAAYSGSADYLASTSANLTQTVNKSASNSVVTTSGTPANFGATVIFTATVTARTPGVGTPTGTVQFRVDGVNVGSPTVLNVAGQAVYSTNALSVGRHTVSAVYAGDGNFNASTSANRNQRIR